MIPPIDGLSVNGQSIAFIKMDIRSRLYLDEGEVLTQYTDTENNQTIGVGHKIKDIPKKLALKLLENITPEQSKVLFDYDFHEAMDSAKRVFRDVWFVLGPVRRGVLVMMVYQLGPTGASKFRNMHQAIRDQDYVKAGKEMLDSSWGRKHKTRVNRLACFMRKGSD